MPTQTPTFPGLRWGWEGYLAVLNSDHVARGESWWCLTRATTPCPSPIPSYAALSCGNAISVDANCARAECHHVEESACHHEILVKMEHVGRIADWQVDPKCCAEAQ